MGKDLSPTVSQSHTSTFHLNGSSGKREMRGFPLGKPPLKSQVLSGPLLPVRNSNIYKSLSLVSADPCLNDSDLALRVLPISFHFGELAWLSLIHSCPPIPE